MYRLVVQSTVTRIVNPVWKFHERSAWYIIEHYDKDYPELPPRPEVEPEFGPHGWDRYIIDCKTLAQLDLKLVEYTKKFGILQPQIL